MLLLNPSGGLTKVMSCVRAVSSSVAVVTVTVEVVADVLTECACWLFCFVGLRTPALMLLLLLLLPALQDTRDEKALLRG